MHLIQRPAGPSVPGLFTFRPECSGDRAAMGPLTTALFVISAATLVYLLWLSLQLHRQKPAGLAWRGIIKALSLGGAPVAIAPLYARWFNAFWAFFGLGSLAVAFAVWGTDHSFLVVIFPLLFYYFFARYFLWEKEDLSD